MKGKVVFDTDRCKGCGLCVSVCPVQILSLDEQAINAQGYHPAICIDQTRCIACANCALMCPDVVISVFRAEVQA